MSDNQTVIKIEKPIQFIMAELNGSSCITISFKRQTVIKIENNPVYHGRTKHVKLHYHFIQEKVQEGEVEFIHSRTKDQHADLCTK